MCAAYAGALGIPTVFVSGERQTGLEAAHNLPRPLEFVCDEIGLSNHAAICRPFKSLEKELAEKTRRALGHIGKTRPFNVGPVTFKLKMRYQGISEKIASLPFVRREGDWLVVQARNAIESFHAYLLIIIARDFWDVKQGAAAAPPAGAAKLKSNATKK